MKKNLLMGLIGLGAFAILAPSVKAETVNLDNISETGKSVLVGEVDAPVYSVDIEWGDMTFDYEYDEAKEQYYWREKIECNKIEDGKNIRSWYNNNELDVYYDDACKNELAEENYDFDDVLAMDAYYATSVGGGVSITDNSKNGKITPSISWTSESNYDFVDANFYYEGTVNRCVSVVDESDFNFVMNDGFDFYTDSKCTTKETSTPAFEAGKYYFLESGGGWVKMPNHIITEDMSLSGDMYHTNYFLKIELVNNLSKVVKTPIKGDKIGTITISIDAK